MKVLLWEQIRKQKRSILAQMGLGLLCLGLAPLPWLLHLQGQPKSPPEISGQALCVGAWRGLDSQFQPLVQGSAVLVRHPLSANPKLLLAQASLGIALCHTNYRLGFFCMGGGCANPGLTLRLVPREQANAPRP